MIEILKPDFFFADDRGSLTQLVHQNWRQVNVITSRKNAVRGGHYHKKNREAFFIIEGSLELSIEKDEIKEKHVFKKGDMFLIPIGIFHSFLFIEDTILVSLYDMGVELEDGKKDIYVGDK